MQCLKSTLGLRPCIPCKQYYVAASAAVPVPQPPCQRFSYGLCEACLWWEESCLVQRLLHHLVQPFARACLICRMQHTSAMSHLASLPTAFLTCPDFCRDATKHSLDLEECLDRVLRLSHAHDKVCCVQGWPPSVLNFLSYFHFLFSSYPHSTLLQLGIATST